MKLQFFKTGPGRGYARGLGITLQFGRVPDGEFTVVKQLSIMLGLWFVVIRLILWREK